jgi:hypothetical protein
MAEGVMMSRSRWSVVAVASILLGGMATAAAAHDFSMAVPPALRSVAPTGDPLAVRVYPTVAPAGSDAWVSVRVEPDHRSVSLVIAWLSDDGAGGSHLITLDGANAAIRHQYSIRGLAPGDYEVTAVLTRQDGTTLLRTARLVVAGGR